MAVNLDQLQGELLGIFFEESEEGLDILESGLLQLASGDSTAETIADIFRAAHSIKGASGTFGFADIANLTHVMETLLDQARAGERQITADRVDVLLTSVDTLRAIFAAHQAHKEPDSQRIAEAQAALNAELATEAPAAGVAATIPVTAPGAKNRRAASWRILFEPSPEMMRTGNDPVLMFRELAELGELTTEVQLDRLPGFADLDPTTCYLGWTLQLKGDASHEQLDEIFAWVVDDAKIEIAPVETDQDVEADTSGTAKTKTAQTRSAAAGASAAQGAGNSTGTVRVSVEKIDSLMNMVGELVITQSILGHVDENFDLGRLDQLRDGLFQLARNTRELQDSVMRIRSMPISVVFNRFVRLVHDLSRQLGKRVELHLTGETTELDKTVLEKLSDPLVHLVRNSLDHGFETPEERRAAGKDETGILHLDALHVAGNIIIRISDDGRGMSRERILTKARAQGIVGDNEELTDDELYALIFSAGFSTATEVSDVSGRGVGLDVVKKNIASLGGAITTDSQEGVGTTITIRLPLTLAILDGQLIRAAGETYIIPLVSIVESVQIRRQYLNDIAECGETYRLREDVLPIVRLSEVFGLVSDHVDLDGGLLVVVEGNSRRVGVVVDELAAQQQVVIKSLDDNYGRVEGLSGATILGDGTVALILDIGGLVGVAHERTATEGSRATLTTNQTAEDSATSPAAA